MAKIISPRDFDRVLQENNLTSLGVFSGVRTESGQLIKYRVRCNTCDTEFWTDFRDDTPRVCPYCKTHEFRSQRERQLEIFIRSLGYDVEISNREILDGYEIDLYVPSKQIGFELNGIAYHSFASNFECLSYKTEDYHLKKTLLALSKGVALYHLWDYESLESCKLLIKEVLSGQLQLTSWVDKNPYLAPNAQLVPLFYVTKDYPPYHKGIYTVRPRIWDDRRVQVYEFFNSGFCKL